MVSAAAPQGPQVLVLFQQDPGKGNLLPDPGRVRAPGREGPEPVHQLRGAGLFVNAPELPDPVKGRHGLAEQLADI